MTLLIITIVKFVYSPFTQIFLTVIPIKISYLSSKNHTFFPVRTFLREFKINFFSAKPLIRNQLNFANFGIE